MLGLSREEFLRSSVKGFEALSRRFEDGRKRQEQHQEFMLAQLTAVVANFGFRAPKKPFATFDFMPSRTSRSKPVKRFRRRPKAAVAAEARSIFDLFRARSASC